MQNKHEIPIPENHTAKTKTVDGKVVVTFEPVIDLSRIKTGSRVMIKYTGQHCAGIDKINITEPVDVVFFNTFCGIDSDHTFFVDEIRRTFCTFHQNGNFVLFSGKNNKYVLSVIGY